MFIFSVLQEKGKELCALHVKYVRHKVWKKAGRNVCGEGHCTGIKHNTWIMWCIRSSLSASQALTRQQVISGLTFRSFSQLNNKVLQWIQMERLCRLWGKVLLFFFLFCWKCANQLFLICSWLGQVIHSPGPRKGKLRDTPAFWGQGVYESFQQALLENCSGTRCPHWFTDSFWVANDI